MALETTQVLATAATAYGVGGALSILLQARQMFGSVLRPATWSQCS